MSNFKKAFSVAVTALTAIGTMGLAGLAGLPVSAAASAGNLIKLSCPAFSGVNDPCRAVYYFDGAKRFVFPNEKTYMSWYPDFSGVMTVPFSELSSYPIGGNVTVRPGTWLVKITTDPKVYAVEPGGKLRAIDSEARALKLYGSMWNKRIIDVSDAFFVNYTTGAAINSDMHTTGTVINYASNPSQWYYIQAGTKRAFASAAALAANWIRTASFGVTTDISYPDGSSITGNEFALTNVSGGASVIIPGAGTGLSVSLASDTPVSASVPKSGTNVKFLALNFTAGNDGPVTLDGFTLRRTGVGSASLFASVYVYDGANRLTSGRTVNSTSNEVMFSGLNFQIPAGATRKLWVTADIASSITSGQTSNFVLESASKVTSIGGGSVAISGSFPIAGNMMTFVDVTIGTLTVTKNGSISAPKVGQGMAKVSEFKLAAATEDIAVSRIALYQAGSISRGNLMNFKLRAQGTSTDLATVAAISTKDLVSFELTSPYVITQGNDRVFEVFADVGGTARAGDTIKLYIDEASDIAAMGQTYGYGTKLVKTGFDNDAADHHVLTLEGGKLTITFEGPTNTDVSKNTNDYPVYKFNMTAAQTMEIRKMSFTIASPGEDNDNNDGTGLIDDVTGADDPDTANFQDIKVKDLDSGLIITSSKELSVSGSDTTQDISFTDFFTLTAGTTRHFALLTDIKTNNPSNNDLKVTMLIDVSQTDFIAKSIDTSDFITDIVPSVDLVGNTITVKTSALTLGVASTPVSDTVVKRATSVPTVGFTFQAGTSSDITVTSIKLSGYCDDTAAGVFTLNACTGGVADINNLVNSVRLYQGDDLTTPIAAAKSLSSDGTVTFSSLTWKITAGTTQKLVVRADISDSVIANNRIKFDITTAATDVTAQDKDSNTVTATGDAANQTTVDAGTRITFATSGTLTANTDAATPVSGIVLAGSTNVLFTAARLSATKEDFQLKKFNVTQTTSGANGSISGIRISYPGASGTVTAGPYALDGNGTAAIDISSNPMIIGKSASAVISIYADVAAFVLTDGSESGKRPVITFDNPTSTPTGGIAFEAVGIASGTTLTDFSTALGADITSTTQIVYKSRPVISSSTFTATAVNGEMEIYKWTAGASGGSVAVKQFGLAIAITDNVGTDTTETLGSFKLLRDSTDITDQVMIVDQAGGTLETAATFAESDTTAYIVFGAAAQGEETINAGTTYTYSLRATAAGFTTPADDDNFTVSMLGDSSVGSTKKYLTDVDATAVEIIATLDIAAGSSQEALPIYFIWSDNSAIPHSAATPDATAVPTSSGDWTNGFLVKNLPLSQTSFVY